MSRLRRCPGRLLRPQRRLTRVMMKGRLGAPRFDALSAVSRAHANKDYGIKDLTRGKRRTRLMLADLEPLRAQNIEVERFLKQVEAHPDG